MNDRGANVFVFPPYTLDPGQRRVSHNGQPIPLTPKEFDTLHVLVEAGGTVVEKNALIAQVWSDRYVGDGSLARNISVLRKALGENVIETLPRRGYRLAVPVQSVAKGAWPPASEDAAEGSAPSTPADRPVAIDRRVPWRNRSLVLGSVILAIVLLATGLSLLFIGTARAHLSPANAKPIHSILIQKEGALDPLDEGFKLFLPDGHYAHTLHNRETNGWDRWRIVTNNQNYYARPLSTAEKDFALQRDWRLTCVCALERGGGFADVDFAGEGPRFDIGFLQEGDRYFIGLTKQISPTFDWDQKIEFPGVADVDHPHTYELRYDHKSRTASFWIDSRLMASGYRGHRQFQEDMGVMFGAAIYRDAATSSMVFRTVRFDAH